LAVSKLSFKLSKIQMLVKKNGWKLFLEPFLNFFQNFVLEKNNLNYENDLVQNLIICSLKLLPEKVENIEKEKRKSREAKIDRW